MSVRPTRTVQVEDPNTQGAIAFLDTATHRGARVEAYVKAGRVFVQVMACTSPDTWNFEHMEINLTPWGEGERESEQA
jgi:hypothetical protein